MYIYTLRDTCNMQLFHTSMTVSTKTMFHQLVYSLEEASIYNRITRSKQLSFQGLQKYWPHVELWDQNVVG